MKAMFKRTCRTLLLLTFTIIAIACQPETNDNRYSAFDFGGRFMGVIDEQTSEVFIFNSKTESWYSIGKPSKTNLTQADWPE